MKAKVCFLIVLFLIMLAIPAAVIGFSSPGGISPQGESSMESPSQSSTEPNPASQASSSTESSGPSGQGQGSFRVLDESTGKTQELSYSDFLIGVVSAEMPAAFEKEALKAQAVASMTFFLKKKEGQAASPDAALKDADFSLDSPKAPAI